MKKIYLIGDSIREGYDQFVQEELAGKALVYWSADNARYVWYTLRALWDWTQPAWDSMWTSCGFDPKEIDIVHWNNGLWDALHMLGDETQTSYEEYRHGLERIIRRLKVIFPNAQITFALSTSVIESRMSEIFYRRNAEIEQYNEIARQVMARENIPIDDLYAVATQMSDDWHAADGTHYTKEGFQALGHAVAQFLESLL